MFLLAESYVGMGPVSFSAISAAVLRELGGKDLTAEFAEKIPPRAQRKAESSSSELVPAQAPAQPVTAARWISR
ncbi:MAG TPA: hypothetical protein VNX87_13760 [Candidatus Sulfotelmatobacter sp.]|jgi:hypothetical protein|nr:hypothetical protein [Candidatus Sulfotelmatobacter sp.]